MEALRLVGAVIATCGVALLGLGTFTSPLSSGHLKLAGTTISTPGSGCDDEDECGSCVKTSSHTSTPEVFDAIPAVPGNVLSLSLPTGLGDEFGDDDAGDCTTSTTSHATSSAGSCRTGGDEAAAVETCTTSKTTSSKTTSSSVSSSSAGSSGSASTSGSTHTSTTTTAGTLGVSTTTPSTGSDLAFGLGLILLIGGSGLEAGGYRYRRRRTQ